MSFRPNSFQALRIVAWGSIQLQKKRIRLGPLFHCPTCLRPEKNLPKGCPKCELTEKVNETRRRIIEEAAIRWGKYGGGWPFPNWPIDKVFEIHNYVALMLGENEDRVSDDWFEDVAAMSYIIRSEQAQDRAVERAFPEKR